MKTFLVLLCLSGCVSQEPVDMISYEKLREGNQHSAEELAEVAAAPDHIEETRVFDGPVSKVEPGIAGDSQVDLDLTLPEGMFEGAYNNMSVPVFINEVFGEQLGLSFSVNPAVQNLKDLVSLRLMDDVRADRLFRVAEQTLANYGVVASLEDGVLVFSLSEDAGIGDVPLVLSGLALPDVPDGHRPLFFFYEVNVVNANSLRRWLMPALRGQDITIEHVVNTNALLLKGKQPIVEQAISMIELLDQPSQRGRVTAIVEPVFTQAGSLATDLVQILGVQGYFATNKGPLGSIVIYPTRSDNKIVLIAVDEATLNHAVDWAKSLDKQTVSGIENGVFTYRARNTDVEHLVGLLNQLETGQRETTVRGNNTVAPESKASSGRFIADKNRNAIVYRGAGKEWVELIPTIREMDQPTPSVLVEVLLAEVTLNNQDETGIEFIARSGDVTFSTLGGLGLGGSGLTATLNRAGETRAILNAFYKSERANIRSRPRLMVKSGHAARIDVGNEIPYITTSSQSVDTPGAPVIQSVAYRKTGIQLEIEPVVHSSGYVDLRVTQQLSEAQQTSTSEIDSPTIFNRTLQTTVTLRDGGSVLLGGLISEVSSTADNGVKGLGGIPGVGRLFRTDAKSRDKTELVMMIVPYIIQNPDEAAKLSDRALEILELTR